MITENLSTLKIHKLTQKQYNRELAAGNLDENALYLTPDESTISSGEGKSSVVIGSGTATGENSVVIGTGAATGEGATVIGNGTASGDYSFAEGLNTIARGDYQHVQGKWNIIDARYAHIVGNGTGEDDYDDIGNYIEPHRSNSHTPDWGGNAWFAGSIKVGGKGQDDSVAKELATRDYVGEKIAELVDSAPETLNTLNALATVISSLQAEINSLKNGNNGSSNVVNLVFDYNPETDEYEIAPPEAVQYRFEEAKYAFAEGKTVTLGWFVAYTECNITRYPCVKYNDGSDDGSYEEYLLFAGCNSNGEFAAYRLTSDGSVREIKANNSGGGDGGGDGGGEDVPEDLRFRDSWGNEYGVPSGFTWREAIDQGLIYGVSDQIAEGCVGCGENYALFSYSDTYDKVYRDTCPFCDGTAYVLMGSDGPDAATVSPDEHIYEQTYYFVGDYYDGDDSEGEVTEKSFFIGNSHYIINGDTTFEDLCMGDFFLRECSECGEQFQEVWCASDDEVYCLSDHGCVEDPTKYRVVTSNGYNASPYEVINDGDQFYLEAVAEP